VDSRTPAQQSLAQRPIAKPRSCSVKVPGTTNGVLSFTTKMPCPSFSLPAGEACPFAMLKPLLNLETGRKHEAICGKKSCYAKRNFYAMYARPSQLARYQWATDCMRRGNAGIDEFVAVLVKAITKYCTKMDTTYFRIHDSGDFFSPTYVRAWIRIVDALPEITFWAPTRSYRAPWLAQLLELAARPNVTMRPSALHFDVDAPIVEGMAAGSTASSTMHTCPAKDQDGECRDCRQCWDAPDTAVIYGKH
jgi:Gene product 88